MIRRVSLAFILLSPLFGADSLTLVPVEVTHENGTFTGQMEVSMTGPMNKVKTEWRGSITNTSPHGVFRADFCVKAFDSSGQPIKPGGEECVIRVWGWNWAQGASLKWKGKQDIKVSDEKTPLTIGEFVVTATDVFSNAPNLRELGTRCSLAWPAAIRVFADRKFRPTVMDKDSFTATYAYDGGRIDNGSRNFLRSYTSAYTGWSMTWTSFRVDAASLYLREEKVGTCTAEVKMAFAGFGKPLFGQYGWVAVESNFNLEKELMDEIEAQSKRVADNDLDKAIGQLPTSAANVVEGAVAKPQLTLTSQPDGAEIEINGEFIGNTPTIVSTIEGKVTIKITKSGYQPWERTLTLVAGDKRTVAIEMSK